MHESSVSKYASMIKKIPMLPQEEQLKLILQYRETKNKKIAETLVTSNLRFVLKCAHKYRGYSCGLQDLIQAGSEGLIRSLDRFDPTKNTAFLSYAAFWIKAFMHKLIQNNHSLVKFATNNTERKLFYRLKGMIAELERLGETDIDGALSAALGLPVEKVQDLRQRIVSKDMSLNAPMGDDNDGASFIDNLSDFSDSEQEFNKAQREHQIRHYLKKADLDNRERYIVEKRLLDDETTLQEVGDHFGVSRERVRQLEARVVSKLQKTFAWTELR